LPQVEVKLLAVLRGLTEKSEFQVTVPEGATLRELVTNIAENAHPVFKKRFLNSKSDGLSPDIIVLINGAEASIHGGMAAVLREGSEVIFLPTVHGG
jgi:molybdopterin converting factor small subunit